MIPDWIKKFGPAVTRLAVGHFASYPPSFLWVIALMPPIILSFSPAELAVLSEQAAGKKITYRSLEFAGIVFTLVHALSVPWALAKDEATAKKRQKAFFISVIALLFLGIVVGVVGWGYFIFFLK